MTKRILSFGGIAICVSCVVLDYEFIYGILGLGDEVCGPDIRTQGGSMAVFETGYIESTPSRARITNVVPEIVSGLEHRSLGGKKETYYTK
jgi:hypothetical protein